MSETCPLCRGTGQMPAEPPSGLRPAPGSETHNCKRCAATGQVDYLKDDEVPVPADEVEPHRRGGPLG